MAQVTTFAAVVAGLTIGKILATSLCQTIARKKVVLKNLRWELMFKKIISMTRNGILFRSVKIVTQTPEIRWRLATLSL